MAILKGIISNLNGSAGNLTFKQLGGPEAEACSNCASRVPGADNRTEILSPANEQYKGRKSLAAVPEALRAFQRPRAVPYGSNCASRVPEAKGVPKESGEEGKKRKEVISTSQSILNLKSNTRKNTMQNYCFSAI